MVRLQFCREWFAQKPDSKSNLKKTMGEKKLT
jgi:hypothetical protein